MKTFFQTALSQLIAFDRRLAGVVLMALISSQGCGIIADAPDRALSTRGVPPAEAKPKTPSSDKPPAPADRSETPPVANVPSPLENKQTTGAARIPAPSQPTQSPPTLTETGLASWYGAKHHGKRTASGEVFNQEELTAAHPTLPWGSRVKVINLENSKSVDVRINDRGPYKKGRIIDVSRAAARALGMVQRGITNVRIEWVPESEKASELAWQDR
jgi:rare lipoprotein A